MDKKQYHIQCKKGDVGRYVILPGDPGRCEKIAQYFEAPRLIASNREYVTFSGFLDGEKVSVTSTGIGGPSAAIAIEELVAIGADTFIRVGTSGGISTKINVGDLVIASGAIRMEGTTKEYLPIEFPAVAHFEITRALVDAAEKLEIPHHVGVVQCKDSFYGQHAPERMPVGYELSNKWDAWKRGGALTSEMESAALFVTSSVLGARSGSVLFVGVNPELRKAGVDQGHSSEVERGIKVAIEALRTIISGDRFS